MFQSRVWELIHQSHEKGDLVEFGEDIREYLDRPLMLADDRFDQRQLDLLDWAGCDRIRECALRYVTPDLLGHIDTESEEGVLRLFARVLDKDRCAGLNEEIRNLVAA